MKNKLHISPLFIIIWFFLIIFDKENCLFELFLAACLHEIAHLYFYFLFGKNIKQLKIMPFGLSIKIDESSSLNSNEEIICSLAGIIINLITAGITYFFNGTNYFFVANILLASLNLIPITPLDGGRAVYFILLKHFKQPIAYKISHTISIILLIPFTFLAVYIMFITKYNFSLLIISIYLAFCTFFGKDL